MFAEVIARFLCLEEVFRFGLLSTPEQVAVFLTFLVTGAPQGHKSDECFI